jgi:hypothetical protein
MGARIDGSPSALLIFHDAAKALGLVFMYSGNIASIPAGYHLCDGTAGTKDLRNRFIVAADADSGGVAKTNMTGTGPTISGGSILTDGAYTGVTDLGHTHLFDFTLDAGTEIPDVSPAGNFASSLTTPTYTASNSASIDDPGHAHGAIPPYYTLAFIQAI